MQKSKMTILVFLGLSGVNLTQALTPPQLKAIVSEIADESKNDKSGAANKADLIMAIDIYRNIKPQSIADEVASKINDKWGAFFPEAKKDALDKLPRYPNLTENKTIKAATLQVFENNQDMANLLKGTANLDVIDLDTKQSILK